MLKLWKVHAFPLAVEIETTLLGLAAIITAITGIISTVLGGRRKAHEATEKAEDDCRRKLRLVRVEAEEAASELHQRRMREARGEK